MFELTFSPVIIALAAVMVVAVAVTWLCSLTRLRLIYMRGRAEAKPSDHLQPVSVIVYSREGDEGLKALLEQIFAQDYAGEKEVIVVNDGAPTEVQEVVGTLQHTYPNLYLTFVPQGSRNLSRKKMALTLGIKAANFDIVVLTCSNCRIPSTGWLSAMVAPFNHGKDVVIGYARPVGDEGQSVRGLMKIDYLYAAVIWLSAAVMRRAYRGTEYNLAYRRSLFFDNRGFSAHQNLNFGDDDIFISQVTNRRNTRCVLSPESIIETADYNVAKAHKLWRMKYDFTRQFLHTGSPAAMAVGTAAMWVTLGSAIALGLFGLPSLIPAIFAVVIWIAIFIWQAFSWRRAARTLGYRIGWLSPLSIMFHPVYGLKCRMVSRKNRENNYTWRQQG